MILEAATLHIEPAQAAFFEQAYRQAQQHLAAAPGYQGHQLQRCLETAGRYLLLVTWESVAAHEEGFRRSVHYEAWRRLIHPFLVPPTLVEHYQRVV